MTRLVRSTLALILAASAARAQQPAASPAGSTIASRTTGYDKRDGFIPVYLDDKTGRILLEIPRDSLRVLHFINQATGLGSNPIGIDRGGGQVDNLARFERHADRVLLIWENTSYRSSATNNAAHVRTVNESFPPSTVASLPLLAEEGGRLLVDATDFLLRDWTDVAATLAGAGEGTYAVARDRSKYDTPHTRAWPENTELDASLTFATTGRPGRVVSQIVPDGKAFTLRVHHSFVKLPDDHFRPRFGDPRIGFFGPDYKDYAQPVQRALAQQLISRHRLERTDPDDPRAPFKKPITYYIDRGIPEPIRTATREGVSWWIEAFDRAGLVGAFRVEDLPEGVDPMDARYNVVQWVNRNERGWSVGGSVGDQRTGEIVKAMARMDSHRARTDYNLLAGLMGAEAAAADTAFVLARVRQVSAHEVGHTLGLAHNYIASTYERGSVMDYPAPRVRLDASGTIDIGKAYATGPGVYDVWAIHWGYGVFPAASERDSLAAIMADGLRQGYLFLSDQDARPENASDPRVNLWDDAATATEFMSHQSDVRRVAIRRFGLRNIRAGEPLALLQERFVPVYFMHRFAINSLAKTVGGMEYSNAIAGDGQQATRIIPAARQRSALKQLISALEPAELAIPDTILTLMVPVPLGRGPNVEVIRSRTEPQFDEIGAARTLASMIVEAILQRERAGRLAQQGARDGDQLTLLETMEALAAATWNVPPSAGSRKLGAMRQVAQRAVVDRLLQLAADENASPPVRGQVEYEIGLLRTEAAAKAKAAAGTPPLAAHWTSIAGDLARWVDRRELPRPTPALRAPPGDPFGEEP